MFHPALHEQALLAGQTVALATDCQSCGQTLSMEWALPNAGELRAHAAAAQVESLPVAAGAEGWSHALPAAPAAPAELAAPSAPIARPGSLFRDALPERTPVPARTLHEATPADAPHQSPWRLAEAAAERRPEPDPVPTDPAMGEFLTQFTDRIDRARRNLGAASENLPSAISGELRRPKLSRPVPVDTHVLSSRPSGFAAPAPAPAAPEVPEVDAPLIPAAPVDALALDAPLPAALAQAVAPTASVFEPAPAPAPAAAPAPALVAAPIPPRTPLVAVPDIAPTDADVFPPVAVAAPITPPSPVLAGGPAFAPPSTAPAAFAPPAPPTAAPAFAPPLVSTQLAAEPAPTVVPAFAPSFAPPQPGTAQAPTPALPSLPADAAAFADATPVSAELAGALTIAPDGFPQLANTAPQPQQFPPAAPDGSEGSVAAAFEPDRGFDWGSDADATETPRRARRARGRKTRTTSQQDALSLPGVSSYADAEVAVAAAPDGRTRLGIMEIACVVFLAVIAVVAGFKIYTSPTDAAVTTPPAATTTAEQDIVPAVSDATAGAGTTSKAGASKLTPAQAKAAKLKAAKAAAARKAAAAKAANAKPATAKATTGTPVANTDAAAKTAQVPEPSADTAGSSAAEPSTTDESASTR
ncbi:MAG: hypothetical protein JWN72_2442 [Thermoleophilia bacterium]|nr:hypothetical protein [Thermoleophilia bacterium]